MKVYESRGQTLRNRRLHQNARRRQQILHRCPSQKRVRIKQRHQESRKQVEYRVANNGKIRGRRTSKAAIMTQAKDQLETNANRQQLFQARIKATKLSFCRARIKEQHLITAVV